MLDVGRADGCRRTLAIRHSSPSVSRPSLLLQWPRLYFSEDERHHPWHLPERGLDPGCDDVPARDIRPHLHISSDAVCEGHATRSFLNSILHALNPALRSSWQSLRTTSANQTCVISDALGEIQLGTEDASTGILKVHTMFRKRRRSVTLNSI